MKSCSLIWTGDTCLRLRAQSPALRNNACISAPVKYSVIFASFLKSIWSSTFDFRDKTFSMSNRSSLDGNATNMC